MEDSTTITVLAGNADLGRYLSTTSPTHVLQPEELEQIDVKDTLKYLYEAFLKEFTEISFLCYKRSQNTCTLWAKSNSGKEYAIKTLLLPPSMKSAEEENEIEKFRAETDLTDMMNKFLHGEGVAKVISHGKKKLHDLQDLCLIPKEAPYFITEYYPGGDLESIAVQNFPLSKKINIFAQVAETVSFMHKNYHIVHRDLKPENIMLTENEKPMLIDFGSFEIMGRKYRLTETGTKPYFSPTQAKSIIALQESIRNKTWINLPEHTYRTDMYALTFVMADVLFRGRGDNTVEIIDELYTDDDAYYQFIASDPLVLFPDSGIKELDDILYRGISNKPNERFSSMQELADALSDLQHKI